MKNKDLSGLAKHSASNFTGGFCKGRMVLIGPVKHVLKGLYFEDSDFNAKSFYVWAFLLPLFVPSKNVNFNLGKRLRNPKGADRWNADEISVTVELDTAVKEQAMSFLLSVESPADLVKAAYPFRKPQDFYVQQAIAYAWAFSGDVIRAEKELNQLLQSLEVKVPWQKEMAERADCLKKMIIENPEEAKNQLKAWEVETLQNLKLDKETGE